MIDTRQLVTVFGGGGFIGRYVCEMLLKTRRPPARRRARPAPRLLPPAAGPGRPVRLRPRRHHRPGRASPRAVEGATAVINLFGILKGDSTRSMSTARGNVAEAARDAGAAALVHVSAIGADPDSASAYGRTKGEGEHAVRAAFPNATIIRPIAGVRPRGPAHQPLRRAWRACRSLPVIAPSDPLPAGLCPRPRAGDRRGGARSASAWRQDLRDRRAAGDDHARAARRDRSRPPASRPSWSTCPISPPTLLSRFGFLPGAPLTRDQWLMLQQRQCRRAKGAPGSRRSGSRRRRSARSRPNGSAASTAAAASPAAAST